MNFQKKSKSLQFLMLQCSVNPNITFLGEKMKKAHKKPRSWNLEENNLFLSHVPRITWKIHRRKIFYFPTLCLVTFRLCSGGVNDISKHPVDCTAHTYNFCLSTSTHDKMIIGIYTNLGLTALACSMWSWGT